MIEEDTTLEEYMLTVDEYINTQNYIEAKKCLLKAQELFPDNIRPLYYLLSMKMTRIITERNFDPKKL